MTGEKKASTSNEYDILDNSNAGSHISGNRTGGTNLKQEFQVTAGHADFERGDDIDEYDEEYDSQEEAVGSDEDAGSFYQPTLIAKTKKTKKKKTKKKSPDRNKMPNLNLQAQTISSEGNILNSKGSKPGGGLPTYPYGGQTGASSNAAQLGQVAASTVNTMGGFNTFENRGPRPVDPKAGLEWDIEHERFKIQQMENRCRLDMEKVRQEHQKSLQESDTRHADKRKQLEDEKAAISTDKNNALEEAKKKLTALNKVDLENREL